MKFVFFLAATALASASVAQTLSVDRISNRPDGSSAHRPASDQSAISPNGRYVVFRSLATDLGPLDTNNGLSLYWKDLEVGTVKLLTINSANWQPAGVVDRPAISGDGSIVAFEQEASTVSDDEPNYWTRNVYWRNVSTGETKSAVRSTDYATGGRPNGNSFDCSLSEDGRYVCYSSEATNLVANDTNGTRDIFVFDRQNGTTVWVSKAANGGNSNGFNFRPIISGNGRYVVWESDATNLISGDTNNRRDIFRRDLQTGTTIRINVNNSNQQTDYDSYHATITRDGGLVCFESRATNLQTQTTGLNVFVRDVAAGTTTLINKTSSGGNYYAYDAEISASGDYVMFRAGDNSFATGDSNGYEDIFVWRRSDKVFKRMSETSAGASGNGLSAVNNEIGRHLADTGDVVFSSGSTNFVAGDTNRCWDVFRKKYSTSILSAVAMGNKGGSYSSTPRISANGRYVVYTSDSDQIVDTDANGAQDVFLYDRQTGKNEVVSRPDGTTLEKDGWWNHGGGDVTDDGNLVVFDSNSFNLVPGKSGGQRELWLRDRSKNQTIRLLKGLNNAEPNNDSYDERITGDGRYVVFTSWASNLVADDNNGYADIFRLDRNDGSIVRVTNGNGSAWWPTISEDGRYVAFQSWADNLVSGDTNKQNDIFVKDLQTNTTILASVGENGQQAVISCDIPEISGDGRYVVWGTDSGNLVSNDTNNTADIFIRDLVANKTKRVTTSASGVQANSGSFWATINYDGRYVSFNSWASNLVDNDTNNGIDIFRKDMLTGKVSKVSVQPDGTQSAGILVRYHPQPEMSADGSVVAFGDWYPNVTSALDDNSSTDVFVATLERPNAPTIAASLNLICAGEDTTLTVSLPKAVTADTVIKLTSSSRLLKIPASVTILKGATSATAVGTAQPLTAVTDVVVTAQLEAESATTTVSVRPWIATMTATPNRLGSGLKPRLTITLQRPAPATGLAILLSSDSAEAKPPASIIIAAASLSGSVDIVTSTVAADKVVRVSAKVRSQTFTIPITLLAPTLATMAFSPSTVDGGSKAYGVVTLTAAAPAAGVEVNLVSAASDTVTVPAKVTVPAGRTSVTFVATTKAADTGNKTVRITASVGAKSVRADVTVRALGISELYVLPDSVQGGEDATLVIVLNQAAPAGGVLVTLRTSDGTLATMATRITIAEGQKEVYVPVTTKPSQTASSVTLRASVGALAKEVSLKINP